MPPLPCNLITERALQDLDGFERCWVISFMHLNKGWNPMVKPPRGPGEKYGLFSTRSPHRPNPGEWKAVRRSRIRFRSSLTETPWNVPAVALSALEITSVDVKEGVVHVLGLDLLDGTPVLDIKPYIPYCDAFPQSRAGWLGSFGEDKPFPAKWLDGSGGEGQ